MNDFVENFSRLENSDRSFDVAYWQNLGPEAIFNAAYDMIKDYLLIKEGYAHEPKFQRTVESFQKVEL